MFLWHSLCVQFIRLRDHISESAAGFVIPPVINSGSSSFDLNESRWIREKSLISAVPIYL